MRSQLTRTLLAAGFAFALAVPAQAAEVWNIDRNHSSVGFTVRHFVTQVPGRFGEFEGTIVYDAENPASSSVEFTVQSASIDTDNDRRDNHLRSPDFFAVEEYPTWSFASKKVAPLGEGKLAVTGDLTIRGVTKEVTVPVEVLGVMGDKAGFATEFTIDRIDYGVTWNRALDSGTLLGEEVEIVLSIEADREKPPEPAEGTATSGD